jgi:hypothetical protein
MVFKDLRAQRHEAIDLRVPVPVIWLKADVDPILHSLVLRHSLDEPRTAPARTKACRRVAATAAM